MAGRKDIDNYAVTVTITTVITEPWEATHQVTEQFAARLGPQGGEGWFNKQIGMPCWQINSVCAVSKGEAR